MQSVTTFFQSRINDNLKLEKRSQKPFEPQRVGPGLNLSYEQESVGLGYHDTTRVLPKNIDELRRKDMPQVSYKPPVLLGKKGEKRSVAAGFVHRRPDKFRETDVNNGVANGGQIKLQRAPDIINLNIGNRLFSTPLQGVAGAKHGIKTPDMSGLVQDSKNNSLQAYNSGPATFLTINTPNQHAYQVYETQRTTTNHEKYGGVSNNMGASSYNPNDVAKTTQQLQNFDSGPTVNLQGIKYYDPNNVANPTQQLGNYIPSNTAFSQGISNYNPNNVANPTQQLGNYIPSNTGFSQGISNYDPNKVANPTQQLQNYIPSNTGFSQGISSYDPNKIANPTQQLQNYDVLNPSSYNHVAAQISDTANPTLRQTTDQPFNTFINRNQGVATQYDDIAKPTQILPEFSTGPVSLYDMVVSQLSDTANPTLRQTTNTPFNTFISTDSSLKTQLQDSMRQTIKESTIQNDNMGNLGLNINTGYTVTDASAKTTIKQGTNYNNYVNPVGNQSTQHSFNATNWEAPVTLKDTTHIIDYVGNIGLNNKSINEMSYNNAHTNTSRENIVQSRAPTLVNYNKGPDQERIGNVELKQSINYDYVSGRNQHSITDKRIELNQESRTKISYDDRIEKEILKILDDNPFVNNVIRDLGNYNNL
jgi:hypothetical protein